jgi:hypothetical protein
MTDGSTERIPDHILAGYPAACATPAHHTDAELRRLLRLLRAARVRTITIGHGRHCTSIAAAAAINAEWTGPDEHVEQIVSWPQEAASWLRPARRIVAGECDAWVIADTPAGFAQLSRRLAHEKRWSAPHTFGFASLASPDLVALTGHTVVGDDRHHQHRRILAHPPPNSGCRQRTRRGPPVTLFDPHLLIDPARLDHRPFPRRGPRRLRRHRRCGVPTRCGAGQPLSRRRPPRHAPGQGRTHRRTSGVDQRRRQLRIPFRQYRPPRPALHRRHPRLRGCVRFRRPRPLGVSRCPQSVPGHRPARLRIRQRTTQHHGSRHRYRRNQTQVA